jgi:hypothetical protein
LPVQYDILDGPGADAWRGVQRAHSEELCLTLHEEQTASRPALENRDKKSTNIRLRPVEIALEIRQRCAPRFDLDEEIGIV